VRVFTPDDTLRHLHEVSDKRHCLAASPAEAEVILVLLPWKDGRQIEAHELIERYPHKCFAVSTTDFPFYTARGIYSTVSGFWGHFGGRVRSGTYQIDATCFKNPFIEREPAGAGIAHPKKYLFSFVGRNCHPVRELLCASQFRRADVLVEDSSTTFALWDENRDENHTVRRQWYFCELLKASKFALCPRGNSPNSMRLFEAIKLGVAPIILSDGWSFPLGPHWEDFSIVVPEERVSELERIVGERENEYEAMGQKAADAYERFFSERAYFNFLVENCAEIRRKQWLPEPLARLLVKTSYRVSLRFSEARKRVGIRTRWRRLLGLSKE
jgi:hypothetical protein